MLLRPALSLGIDPIHLGILTALAIEIGSVIPPVGLNLFAVSGVTGLPVTQVIRGSFPFCCSDKMALIIVLLFPTLAPVATYLASDELFLTITRVLRFISSVSIDSAGACFLRLV